MLKRADGSNISFDAWVRMMRYEEDWEPEPCTQPCPYPAGSPEKIEAMERRMLRGEELYHPDDARTIVRPVTGKLPHPDSRPMRMVILSALQLPPPESQD